MITDKRTLVKLSFVPKVKKLKTFLHRNGFTLRKGKVRKNYKGYAFSKDNPNPNWGSSIEDAHDAVSKLFQISP